MKRRRFCWLGLIAGGVIIAPFLVWLLIVMVAPTGWARAYVVAALEKGSGRSVQLEKLSVCVLGGVELTNLKIGAPKSVGDPWLEALRIQVDVSLWQLMLGKVEPTSLVVDGARLRVLRRADGSLELADLVQSERGPGSNASESDQCGPTRCRAKLSRTQIMIVDQPSGTRLSLEGVGGEGIWEGEGGVHATLSGTLNGGPFDCAAHLDRGKGLPSFEGQFRASDVSLDDGMSALKYLVPVLAGGTARLEGRLGMDVYLRGKGMNRQILQRTLIGHGNVSLDPIELEGTPLLSEIGKLIELPEKGRIGAIRTDFLVKDGRISTDKLTLNLGRFPIVASGWTDFDGRMNYNLKLDGLSDRFASRARRLLGNIDLDLDSLTSIKLSGSVDRLEIRANPARPDGKVPLEDVLSVDDRERLKMLSRRLRDRVVR